jgi:hypothetical protein
MSNQQMILILVIAFFVLGCSFSCNGMKEHLTVCPKCDDQRPTCTLMARLGRTNDCCSNGIPKNCSAPPVAGTSGCSPCPSCPQAPVVAPSIPNCRTVTIGNSSKRSKKTHFKGLKDGYRCPARVDKHNWLGGFTWPDLFDIRQDNNEVTAKRMDESGKDGHGWGMNLKFKCCKDK